MTQLGGGAGIGEFAVEVEDGGRSGALVEVVDILRDHRNAGVFFPRGNLEVAGVRASFVHGFAAVVVEPQDECAVAVPGFRRGDIFDVVVFPKAAAVAKGLQPALGADSRAAEDDDVRLHFGRRSGNSGR